MFAFFALINRTMQLTESHEVCDIVEFCHFSTMMVNVAATKKYFEKSKFSEKTLKLVTFLH